MLEVYIVVIVCVALVVGFIYVSVRNFFSTLRYIKKRQRQNKEIQQWLLNKKYESSSSDDVSS